MRNQEALLHTASFASLLTSTVLPFARMFQVPLDYSFRLCWHIKPNVWNDFEVVMPIRSLIM